MENLYENLNVMEKEVFKKVINQLLGRTFIVNHIYDENKKTAIMNPDYRFVERNIELFRKYLDLGGWKLERNDNYEVIYITSNYGYNKMRLDKFTTVILYILRLMYDQKRENINFPSIFYYFSKLNFIFQLILMSYNNFINLIELNEG